jgi:hypothetical protein
MSLEDSTINRQSIRDLFKFDEARLARQAIVDRDGDEARFGEPFDIARCTPAGTLINTSGPERRRTSPTMRRSCGHGDSDHLRKVQDRLQRR